MRLHPVPHVGPTLHTQLSPGVNELIEWLATDWLDDLIFLFSFSLHNPKDKRDFFLPSSSSFSYVFGAFYLYFGDERKEAEKQTNRRRRNVEWSPTQRWRRIDRNRRFHDWTFFFSSLLSFIFKKFNVRFVLKTLKQTVDRERRQDTPKTLSSSWLWWLVPWD